MGAEISRRLAAEGALVALVDQDGAAARSSAETIRSGGRQAWAYEVDVRSPDEVSRAVAHFAGQVSDVSVLVNCAGVVRYGTVVDLEIADWDLQIATNLSGAFLTCKHVIPLMRRAGGGSIVNVASVQAFASQQLVAAYAASKGGLVALTKTIALDHAAEGITVNCVCPGSIETPMLRYGAQLFGSNDVERTMQEWGRSHPAGYLGQPSDVASSVLFLLSGEAHFITGAVLAVDGGLLAKLAV
jgi:NAD(P)-dependent dehydrogenase (short-subunit alcohol dehydrogenase family)